MSSYVIIDLEMCYVPRTKENANSGYRSELIQIGAVLLDEDYNESGSFMTLVAPQYGTIDARIAELTGISPAAAAAGPDTRTAMDEFSNWLPDDTVIVSWSETDRQQLLSEINYKQLDMPKLMGLMDTWLDCQQLFGEKMNAAKQYKLSEALIIADIDSVDGEHDALIDARNTAKLFRKIQTEDELTLNSYYGAKEEAPATYNPFAALLAGFKADERSMHVRHVDAMSENIIIKNVRRDTELHRRLIDYVESFSWLEVKEHTLQVLRNWSFTDWETPFAALAGDRIVGMATIAKSDYYPLPEIFPWISTIFVSEEFRGRRISGLLIGHANSYAKELGFTRTYIPSEHIGLYEKYGYLYIKEIVNYGGGTDRLYAKNI